MLFLSRKYFYVLLPLAILVQVSGLVFPAVFSYTAVYVTMGAMVLSLIATPFSYWKLLASPTLVAIGACFLLISVTLPFVWHGIGDLLALASLLPIVLIPGLLFLAQLQPKLFSPGVIGGLCMLGVVLAAFSGIYESAFLGVSRVGASNNPIHFGGLAVILGYASLIGLFGAQRNWRFIYLLGPVFAGLVAMLTGSRGPVLAAGMLAFTVLPLLVFWFWRDRIFRAVLVAVLVAQAGVVVVGSSFGLARRAIATFQNIAVLFAEGAADSSINERVAIYRGAFDAFWDSPIFGHGTSGMIGAVQHHLRDGRTISYDHLHSDIADFAVLGGVLGLFAYLLLLVAPFLLLLSTPAGDKRKIVLLGSIVISVSYFSLGLTNAVFGILPQTVLYAVLLGNMIVQSWPVDTTPSQS